MACLPVPRTTVLEVFLMTPHAYSPLGILGRIVLLVFMLMLFVCIAGGNPAMVLKPVCDIFAEILEAFLTILCAAVGALLRLVLSAALSALQNVFSALQGHSDRHINR